MKKQQTKKEALKKNLIEFIIFEAIALVIVILGIIISDFILFALIFAVAFALGGLYFWFDGKKRIKHSYCPYCEAKYNYKDDIKWEETESIETNRKETSVVEFECTCPNCKEVTTFTKKFVTAQYVEKTGEWKQYSIDSLVKNFFWK